jgi:hypothetical protein
MGQGGGNEPAAPCKDMTVAATGLLMGIETLRHNQVQFILRPRHGHMKKTALLFDLLGGTGGEIRGNAAIDHIQDGDRLPFLAFRGMDGREDQIILIERRLSSLAARGLGRIKGQIGQKRAAARIARSDFRKLVEVAGADKSVGISLFEIGVQPVAHEIHFGRPVPPWSKAFA